MDRVNISDDQIELVNLYSSEYTQDDLLNLIGNLCSEFGDEKTQKQYVLMLPDVLKRGKAFTIDVAARFAHFVCPKRNQIAQLVEAKQKSMEPVKWVAVLLDIGLRKFTGGVPPIAVAVAIGKLCDYSVELLCKKFPT